MCIVKIPTKNSSVQINAIQLFQSSKGILTTVYLSSLWGSWHQVQIHFTLEIKSHYWFHWTTYLSLQVGQPVVPELLSTLVWIGVRHVERAFLLRRTQQIKENRWSMRQVYIHNRMKSSPKNKEGVSISILQCYILRWKLQLPTFLLSCFPTFLHNCLPLK